MYFIGIDLAWSPRNKSGVSIVKATGKKGELIDSKVLLTDSEIVEFVKQYVKPSDDAYVLIDAPLLVPNETGRRIAEAEVGATFRKYNAGAHPSNRQRLGQWNNGKVRGEEITQQFIDLGFIHDPYVQKLEKARRVIEVYPHPSMVVLFELDTVIKYKNKPKRDYDFRWGQFKKYLGHMKDLEDKVPSLMLPREILEIEIVGLRGKALKDFEDLLDSVFCAYIGLYSWVHPDKVDVFGNMEGGYILTPVFDKK